MWPLAAPLALCGVGGGKADQHRQCRFQHTNAEHEQWRPLQRYIGRREYFAETYSAVARLVSDRAAER